MPQLLLIDPQPIFLDAMNLSLSGVEEIHVWDMTNSGEEAIQILSQHHDQIDMVILSLQMKGGHLTGVYYAEYILHHFPTVRLMVYSVHIRTYLIRQMLRAGVHAYLFKNDSQDLFLAAILAAERNEIYLSGAVQSALRASSHPESLTSLPLCLPQYSQKLIGLMLTAKSLNAMSNQLSIPEDEIRDWQAGLMRHFSVSDVISLLRVLVWENLIG